MRCRLNRKPAERPHNDVEHNVPKPQLRFEGKEHLFDVTCSIVRSARESVSELYRKVAVEDEKDDFERDLEPTV